MSIHATRECLHCAADLGADERLHYVYECHDCAVAGFDLEAAMRRDPFHPEADRLRNGPVEIADLPARSRKILRFPVPPRPAAA